jgi:DNA-damage-inducible protein J
MSVKGVEIMAQTTVSIRMDDQVKKQAEWYCNEFGMSLSTAVTIFAKAIIREHKIPFEIKTYADPFYSEANQTYIRQIIDDIESEQAILIDKTMAELKVMEDE